MLDSIIAFSAQFAFVFLLGFQTVNLRDSNYKLVVLTSVFIGFAELGVITSVVRNIVLGECEWYVWVSFITGGALGVLSSLKLGDYIRQKRRSV